MRERNSGREGGREKKERGGQKKRKTDCDTSFTRNLYGMYDTQYVHHLHTPILN